MKESVKLIISVIMDILGCGSYIIPVYAEITDIIFAPIQMAWIWFAYKSLPATLIGGAEEIIPFTDAIPTCTATHIYYHIKKNKKEVKEG